MYVSQFYYCLCVERYSSAKKSWKEDKKEMEGANERAEKWKNFVQSCSWQDKAATVLLRVKQENAKLKWYVIKNIVPFLQVHTKRKIQWRREIVKKQSGFYSVEHCHIVFSLLMQKCKLVEKNRERCENQSL